MESQFRLTKVLGFGHSLYTLPEVIVPTSGVQLSNTFRYFYSLPGGGLSSMDCQFRLTKVLGFGIPYILYQKLLCLLLLCNSPTLSGISSFSQKVSVVFLGSQLRLISGIRNWHSLYTLPEVIVPTSGVTHSPTLSGICTLHPRRWS